MSTYKVRTAYLTKFNMPPICVACGSPATFGATKKVSLSKNLGNKVSTLTLDFPLCNECQMVSQQKTSEKKAIALGVVVVLVLIIISVSLSVNNETSIYFIIGAVLGIAWVALTTLWIVKHLNKIFTKEQLARRTQVTLCTTINDFASPNKYGSKEDQEGHVKFNFSNSSFADHFAELNQGFKS